VDGIAAAPAARRPNVQMPDEYLPPNKILFLQNLPESVTKDQLMALFSQYVNLLNVASLFLTFSDIQTCTRFGSFQRKKTSRSWNTWTKAAPGLPKTLFTTTNLMGRTRSRFVNMFSSRRTLTFVTDYIRPEVKLPAWSYFGILYYILFFLIDVT